MLQIFNKNASIVIPEKALYSLSKLIYRTEKISIFRITNLIVCSDYRIRKLNRVYRKIDKTTDVLSFQFEDDDFLGEIYLSAHRVEVQARRYNVTFSEELLRLFVHGFLHLAGYDHHQEDERRKMENKEQFYLQHYTKMLKQTSF